MSVFETIQDSKPNARRGIVDLKSFSETKISLIWHISKQNKIKSPS
jgi:hypothetical protein